MNKWHQISYSQPHSGSGIDDNCHIPGERKVVAVMVPEKVLPFCGYIRYGAGDPESPFFVVYHGNSRISAMPYAWCDCLVDEFPREGKDEMRQNEVRGLPERSAENLEAFLDEAYKYMIGAEGTGPFFDYDNIRNWYRYRFGLNKDPKSYDHDAIVAWYLNMFPALAFRGAE